MSQFQPVFNSRVFFTSCPAQFCSCWKVLVCMHAGVDKRLRGLAYCTINGKQEIYRRTLVLNQVVSIDIIVTVVASTG
jgi:hypothetical protein